MRRPLLGVPNLRFATAFERLVDAPLETMNVALDLVPIGEDAVRAPNGDGIVFLWLLLLLPLGSLALGLRISCSASAATLAFLAASSFSASAASANERAVGSISAASFSNSRR
jgi:hypothetical protein